MLVTSLAADHMLISVHRLLHKHRRQARWALAVLAIAATALTAHSMVIGDAMTDHAVGDAAVLCIAAGASVAVAGVAVFAARRPAQRPTWLVEAAATASAVFAPVASGLLVWAGPPDSQVLRL